MNDENHRAISELHSNLADIKHYPENYDDPVQLIEDIEFTLQGLWKFPRDVTFHSHWFEIKGCTCPQMDNLDPKFRGRGKITAGDCPWHAKGVKK